MFGTFNYRKNKIKQLEELPLETKAAILARNGCTMFEYTIPRDIQGKVQEKNGIFFKIPKVEIIYFNTGICFLCVKTNIEESINKSEEKADTLEMNISKTANNYDILKVKVIINSEPQEIMYNYYILKGDKID